MATGTSEIKWKDIDDGRKRTALESVLGAFLDCRECRVMVLTWDLKDCRHQIARRDDQANFHRMLFHGLRSVADWHGDVPWHWTPDQKSDLNDSEVASFLNNTRGYKSLASQANLLGEPRHQIRITSWKQECSKRVPIIGLADFFAGVVRHSIVDYPGCRELRLGRGGQLDLELGIEREPAGRAVAAKRELVVRLHEECSRRRLGVSLSVPERLATHKKGDKVWFWHYEPQSEFDRAPTKPR